MRHYGKLNQLFSDSISNSFANRQAYGILISCVSKAAPQPLLKLCQEDYSQTTYWYRREWLSATSGERALNVDDIQTNNINADKIEDDKGEDGARLISPALTHQCGRGHSAQDINVAILYIQGEDGSIIDGHQASEICQFA